MATPLTTAAQLDAHVEREDVRVIDCRWYLDEPGQGLRAYREGHIPGAVHASLDTDLSATEGPGRHPLPTPQDFANTLARLGVTASTRVVAYDDSGGAIASRLWWMLTDQGHETTSVLDGGIQAWVAAGHVLTTDLPTLPIGSFPTHPWSGVVDRQSVASRDRHTAVIDARSPERYRGDEEPIDRKAGHIPGAISLPQADNLADDLTFLSPAGLRTRFSNAGIADSDLVISQCGSGVTACHNILAMEMAGFDRPLLYVGSWSDWSSSDLPIATGESP
ncbi:MAG: sulfurtransferase [Acidimicrobiia bacterium]